MSVRIKVAIGKSKKDFEPRWRSFNDYMPDIQRNLDGKIKKCNYPNK